MSAFRKNFLGQLIILRLEENRWNASLKRLLDRASPGGILLSAPLPRSAELTREFLHKVGSSTNCPPFLAVRQEGGREDPLRRFFPALPSPRAAAEKGLAAVACLGELIGEALSFLGFNTNFAPLLDLATPLTEKTLGARAFGSDPARVAQCGGAFLRGQRRHRVLACGKHFPGWGSVPQESSRSLAVSGKSMAALWREDLVPYRVLLPQLPMVLVSSAAYKAYDFDHPRPACLSTQVVEGLLRVKLGYRGLAAAYDLESEAVRGTFTLEEAAIQSLNAGCDLLILDQGKPFEDVRRALAAGLESSKLLRQRVQHSLARIRSVKKRLTLPFGRMSKSSLDRLARRFESYSKEFAGEEHRIA